MSPTPPRFPDFAVYWPNGHWFQLLMEYPTLLKSFVGCCLSGMQATIQGRPYERKITLSTMNKVLFNTLNSWAWDMKAYGWPFEELWVTQESQVSIQMNSKQQILLSPLLQFLRFKPALIACISHKIFTAGVQPPWEDWKQLHEQKEWELNS